MKKVLRRSRRFLAIAGLALAALIGWIAWGNAALETTVVSYIDEDLPPAFSGLRIAQVSDLHDAELGAGHSRLVAALEAAHPDLIVFTGDLVDSKRTNLSRSMALVGQAVQIAPVYYVNGNHEALIGDSAYAELTAGLEACGATVLEDECVWLERGGESLCLIGLNDIGHIPVRSVDGKIRAMREALSSLVNLDGGFSIVLSHRPELLESYAACGPDLVLCGHAHGGQLRLPLLGGLIAPGQGLFPDYDSGLYREGDTAMIVSRGIGNSVVPFRINNRPELLVIELQAAE